MRYINLFYAATIFVFASCGTSRKAVSPAEPDVLPKTDSSLTEVQVLNVSNQDTEDANSEDLMMPMTAGSRHNVNVATRHDRGSWKGELQHILDSLSNIGIFETTQLGLCVYDLTEDQMLYSVNAKQRMRPASCEKIVTTVTALDVYGGDLVYSPNVQKPGSGWCWDDKITGQTPFQSADTVTMDQVLLPILKNSDNMLAESLFAKITSNQIKSLIQRVGLKPGDYRIADGSGLSLYNYVSPLLLVKLLEYAWDNEKIRTHFYPSLPIAGVDGTLSKRMKTAPSFTRVRAKTGTVEGISSLAGYAEAANGHMLAFCIINQGVIRTKTGRDFQDKVCNVLTSFPN